MIRPLPVPIECARLVRSPGSDRYKTSFVSSLMSLAAKRPRMAGMAAATLSSDWSVQWGTVCDEAIPLCARQICDLS